MKRTVFFMFLLVAARLCYAQEEASTQIERVQVYLQGAEVRRTASINVKQGRNTFKFTKLSAVLDPATIQVGGDGFTILSVRHEIDFIESPDQPDKVSTLTLRKTRLTDSIAAIDLELGILKKELELLNRNATIVGDQGIENEDFQQAVGFFFEKIPDTQ